VRFGKQQTLFKDPLSDPADAHPKASIRSRHME
jgi:hypothetical protein